MNIIKFPETIEQEMNDPDNEFDSWTGRKETTAKFVSNDSDDTEVVQIVVSTSPIAYYR